MEFSGEKFLEHNKLINKTFGAKNSVISEIKIKY